MEASLTIYFNDGTHISLVYPQQGTSAAERVVLGNRIKEVLQQPFLVFELEEEVMVVPRESIKYLTVTPKPQVLPDTAVRHARLLC